MSNDQPGRRPPAKSGGGGAPMGSTISIIIAVVAVVVGFIILKNINDDNGGGGGGAGVETPDSTGTDSSTVIDPTSTTSTTIPSIPATSAPLDQTQTVVVANASGVGGAAGQMSTALAGVGFTMGTPTNATGVEARLDISKVYFLGGGEGTAASIAAQFGGIQAVAMPTTVPVEGDTAGLGGATVLLMLGKDYGGKPLPALSADTSIAASPLESSTSSSVAG